MRLDSFLAQNYPEHSRATWQKYISAGYVKIGDKTATKTSRATNDHDIKISIPNQDKKPLSLPIIYEDENVIVIDKPAGVLSHSKGALNNEFTVADFIKSHSANSDLPDNNRFGIVHRLDRLTSGVMIGAKNSESMKYLQKQFSDRKAKKTYLAIVEKTPKELIASIDLPIGRNPKHQSQFRVDSRGKSAITDYKVIETYPNGTALVELRPQTGRTHQLRVHLSYINTPIIGDPVYGDRTSNRMMLHASELEITIPGGKRKVFKSKIPICFKEVQ